jgi:ABC-2 type transport system ATP-binding protein
VCIIARGQKVLDGRLAEVKATHGSPSIMLGFDDRADGARAMGVLRDIVSHLDDSGLHAELTLRQGVDSQQVLQRIMAQNVRVNRFEIVQPSLHRIFLELAGPGAATPELRDGMARGEEASDA